MKRISLDQMKNMSIDDLIELYRDGYRLEEHTPIASLSNFHTLNFSNIHALQGLLLDPAVNFGKVTVSTGYDDAAASIILNTNEGSKLPDPSVSGAFNLVWWNSTDYPDPSDDPNKEIVRCTVRTTDTLTVIRPQEGTSTSIKNLAGKTYKMILSPTAKMISDINSAITNLVSDLAGKVDKSGSITQITIRNHNDLQNPNVAGHTIGAFPSSELNQPAKLLKLNTNFAEVDTPQISKYLRKLADIPQFQTWMKNRIGHLPDVTITGAAGENNCRALTFDGTYIWAGLYTLPVKILKINPVDNSYTTITGASGEDFCVALTFDGTYIWAGLDTTPSPFKILKINPADNSYTTITGTSEETACFALTFDGTYIWAGLDTRPVKILKINPADNSYTVITGAPEEYNCQSITFDGTYIWAGLDTPPFKILKINPVDNSYTTITGAAGEDYCYALTFDGTYIWAGLSTTPFKILKINPVDNSYTTITGASGEDYCRALTFDGTYIWAGLDTPPFKILKKFAYLRKADSFSRTQTDVTASRALDTTYTNNDSNRTMQVMATVRCTITPAGGIAYVQGKSDNSDPPTTTASGIVGIEGGLLNEDNSFPIFFWVSPGKKYRIDSTVTNGTVTLGKWFEMSI